MRWISLKRAKFISRNLKKKKVNSLIDVCLKSRKKFF